MLKKKDQHLVINSQLPLQEPSTAAWINLGSSRHSQQANWILSLSYSKSTHFRMCFCYPNIQKTKHLFCSQISHLLRVALAWLGLKEPHAPPGNYFNYFVCVKTDFRSTWTRSVFTAVSVYIDGNTEKWPSGTFPSPCAGKAGWETEVSHDGSLWPGNQKML
jgi:hypothetical protein